VRVYAPDGQSEEPEHVRFGREAERKQSPEREHGCVRPRMSYLRKLEERNAQVKTPDCTAVRMSRLSTWSVRAKLVFDLVNIIVRVTSDPGASLAVHIQRGDGGEGSSLEMMMSRVA
jgi:hypothetical protein